jgi:hypothetical protein
MTQAVSSWQTGIDWDKRVLKVSKYHNERDLMFGLDKAFPLIDDLCAQDSARRDELKQRHELTDDAVATILGYVTTAIQGAGDVWSPENGGWYQRSETGPLTYVVCPDFGTAWRAYRSS